jgi:UDP-4-amino-4,6-dideoxy-N-acetyl-beta-L-altrosamine N-acetyltransferase
MKTILVIAAHPDDEVLGCAGTVARLIKEGHEAYTLILGEGRVSTSKNKGEGKKKVLKEIKRQAQGANRVIGVKGIFMSKYPDNRFDTVPILDIVQTIEKIKSKVKPNIIFTHFEKDLNIDHQITYKAVITATRPLPEETVEEIYSFEVLSSTEWNYPLSFFPDVFFDVSNTLEYKLRALKKYKLELKDFPHPRSLEGVRLNAGYWGMRVGTKYAEAFKVIRGVRPDLIKDFNFQKFLLTNFVNLTEDEKRMVRDWRNVDNVRKWMYHDHIIAKDEHAKFIGKLREKDSDCYWLMKDKKGEYLGVVSLNRIEFRNRSAYIGIYSNPESKVPGKGSILMDALKKIAFDKYNFHTLKLEVIDCNERAINFFKKHGFVEEARLKELIYRDGKWHDVIVMGIVKKAG